MSEWLDIKYIGLIAPRLEKFKVLKQNPYTAIFRCFVCGDSQKNKYKCRGYFISKNGKVAMYCHNCNTTMGLTKVLDELDPSLSQQYKAERFLDTNTHPVMAKPIQSTLDTFAKPVFRKNNHLKQLKTISQLAWDHPAKQYVESRKIPTPYHSKLFYAPKFAKWVNSIIPGKLPEKHDEPRLVIPMLDKDGNMFGFSGREFHDLPGGLRYITTMLDDDLPKIYNLDSVDWNKTVYCTEGQCDAMFLPNSIAMVGADLIDFENFNTETTVIIFDNEPRNTQIVNRMNKYIDKGFNICIWPESMTKKDINKMIMDLNLTKEQVLKIIQTNTYKGLIANLELSKWRKC